MTENGSSPTDNDDGVDCKHGPQECLGNILEICAAFLYPDPMIYLGFAMCLTGRYEEIPQRELVMDCSLEHGMDFDKLNGCVSQDDGGFGIGLLRESVNRTTGAGVTKSCTVRLNNQIRTVRDGGRWKDYEGGHDVDELVSDIKRMYQASDEDWVPRRVPQPANVKASKSRTAKVQKPTTIPALEDAALNRQDPPPSPVEDESMDPLEPVESVPAVEPSTPLEPILALEDLTITTPSSSLLTSSMLDDLTITRPNTDPPAYQTPDLEASSPTESIAAYETPASHIEPVPEY